MPITGKPLYSSIDGSYSTRRAMREFITSTWKYFVVLAVGLGFIVDFWSVRSQIGDIFPVISAFLPLIGLAVGTYASGWIIKAGLQYAMANRAAAKFGNLKNDIRFCRDTFITYRIELASSIDGRANESTLVRLHDSLLNVKYEFDRLGIRYPGVAGEGLEWADIWIEFLSVIAVLSEKADLKEARNYSREMQIA